MFKQANMERNGTIEAEKVILEYYRIISFSFFHTFLYSYIRSIELDNLNEL